MQDIERVSRPCVLRIEDCDVGGTIEEIERDLGLTVAAKLSENENPFGMSPKAMEAVVAELPNAFMYPEHSFCELIDALAAANGVSASMIVVGHGAETLVHLVPQLFVNPGDEVILADVTYSLYQHATTLMDARSVVVPLRDFRHDLQAMAEAVTPRTKLVWLCNPNNPTGTILTRRETQAFLDTVPSDVVVVIDQAYREFVDDPDYADGVELLKQGHENVIVLRTFSKVHGMAGLRLGYCIASSDVCRYLNRLREPFNVNRLAIVASQASLADHDFIERSLENNRLGRDYLTKQLSRLGMEPVASQANFVLVDTKRDAETLYERLLARGVLVRCASDWGLDTFLRITVGRPEENELAVAALEAESSAMGALA
ncbi:MAG: histidinol-phosphate transaminase [Actinobacteria bacterium]|nr:histidinol-phosphate transaminase [Actinomycetota bacterium]